MKTYICYIKSHADAPDFEMELEAESFDQAVDMFLAQINQGNEGEWGREELAKHVTEVPPHPTLPIIE